MKSVILAVLTVSLALCGNLQIQSSLYEVYSVALGYPVTTLTTNADYTCTKSMLDNYDFAWCPSAVNNQWIQVSSPKPEVWVAVIIQGRATFDQWVSQFRISYSVHGHDWQYLDGDRIFAGNSDRNTKVRVNFSKGVMARTIRIHPVQWNGWPSMRFDAIFLES